MREAEQMYPEQLWDMCEQMDRIADMQAHEQAHRIPKPRKPTR